MSLAVVTTKRIHDSALDDDREPKRRESKRREPERGETAQPLQSLTSSLCEICAAIDFNGAFNLSPRADDGTFLSRLALISPESKWRLCRFFACMLQPNSMPLSWSNYGIHLRAFKASQCFGVLGLPRGFKKHVVLAVLPNHRSPFMHDIDWNAVTYWDIGKVIGGSQ